MPPTCQSFMNRKRFEKLVAEALNDLPEVFRAKLNNVAILVEDRPTREYPGRGILLGLFHGVPLTEKSTFHLSLPDRVVLYKKNIEAICATDEEIRHEIRVTLLHELGHFFGLSEEELRDG